PPETRPPGRPVASAAEAAADATRTGNDSAAGIDPAAVPGLGETEGIFADAAGAVPRGIDLAKLAHELKTPLSAIAAASEIMTEGRFGTIGNERYAGYIADIHASARYALDLVERMLNHRSDVAYSQPGDRRAEKIALGEFVAACVSSVEPLAAAKSLAIRECHGSTPVFVTADSTTLRQIVLNLVTNAIKFTPPGGTIFVSTASGEAQSVVLVVEDTGPGMSADAITEAMQPMPSEVPQMRDGGGLGLGLPITRQLAAEMGTTVAIDSAPSRGTRVTVTFPA
ncbi:MAG: sensor histidine kinase, partial [Deltaproteobacteria bacterium]